MEEREESQHIEAPISRSGEATYLLTNGGREESQHTKAPISRSVEATHQLIDDAASGARGAGEAGETEGVRRVEAAMRSLNLQLGDDLTYEQLDPALDLSHYRCRDVQQATPGGRLR